MWRINRMLVSLIIGIALGAVVIRLIWDNYDFDQEVKADPDKYWEWQYKE